MSKLRALSLLPLIACILPACDHTISERAARDEVIIVANDDPAMLKAFDKAHLTFPDFLRRAENPAAGETGFSIKVRISDGTNSEYFWVVPFSHTGSSYSGTLANDGELIPAYHAGQKITFTEPDIVDWLYHDKTTGAMKGNYTACALLSHENPQQAADFMKEYGLDCSDF